MILFTTMVLAVVIFDTLLIFSFGNALDNIPNYLLNQSWALPQRYESSFSAVHKKLFSLFFSFAIISDNAFFIPPTQKRRKTIQLLPPLTYLQERIETILSTPAGQHKRQEAFLIFGILRDSHCRCFPTNWFYFS